MTNLEEKIINVINATSFKEVAIILDNNYYYHHGKMVYAAVKVLKSGKQILFFYTKNSKSNLEGNEDVVEIIPNAIKHIDNFICRTDILETNVEVIVPPKAESNYLNYSDIRVDTGFGLLFIKSILFYSLEKLLKSDDKSATFRFGERIIPKEELEQLLKLFKREAFLGYKNIVYNQTSTRFLTKFYKYNKFYSIQRAFIPVFVDYKYLYNPLLASDLKVNQTNLFQEALKHNRIIEINNSLTGYMLTHLEICKALGMKHFMRFTPTFLFEVFVGLVQPTNGFFPNKINKVMVLPEAVNHKFYTVKSFTEYEYKRELEKLAKQYKNTTEETNKSTILDKIAELQKYESRNTLLDCCETHYQKLTSIGSFSLDNKESSSLDCIYSYICEASLLYGGK